MRAKSALIILTAVVAVAVAVLSGFWLLGGGGDGGNDDGGTGGKSGNSSGAASSPVPERTYDKNHTRIRVAPGRRFALKLEENPGTGYAWVTDPPEPDTSVIEATGRSFQGSDPERLGSGGTRFLEFRARAPGRTTVKLRHCFRCGTSSERTDEDHEATKVTFDVTVRK